MSFAPTPEQDKAIELFKTGENLAIEAGAGTGKTSTLKLCADTVVNGQGVPTKSGRFISFNKSIAQDAAGKFPAHVTCSTAHSLAFRAVGVKYKSRLNSNRMTSREIANRLRIESIKITGVGGNSRTLGAGFLAGRVMEAIGNFCRSADMEVGPQHFSYMDGIDMPEGNGRRTYANNDMLRAELLPAARVAWADLASLTGQLPFKHDHYLKLWHLGDPVVPCDFLLFDEAQDANPVMLAIVENQIKHGAQLVFVGDTQQQIYEWTGAINALAKVPADNRAFLTKSFRFGPAVADMANVMLDRLDAELRIEGFEQVDSKVGFLANPGAILCRTNAATVQTVMDGQVAGKKVHLVGDGTEVVRFAEAAEQLKEKGWTSYGELACFGSWDEVKIYVSEDPAGSELKQMVKLVEDFGTEGIKAAFGSLVSEAKADVIVSTGHKSKGREWDSVQLNSDFNLPNVEPGQEADSELRLMYVAATRAKLELDVSLVPAFGQDGGSGCPAEPETPVGPQGPTDSKPAQQWFDAVTGEPIPTPTNLKEVV